MNSTHRLWASCVTIAVFAMLPDFAASQTEHGPVGMGPGTEDYDEQCPAGQYMVGATGTTGWYVDEITVFCAPFGADGRQAAAPIALDTAGVPGAESYTQMCADGAYVSSISGEEGTYVGSIALTCTSLLGASANTFAAMGGGGPVEYELPENPVPGEAITGIFGRSGWWIDTLNIKTKQLCQQLPAISLDEPSPGTTANSLTPTFSWRTEPSETVGITYELCVNTPGGDNCTIYPGSGGFPTIDKSHTVATPIDFSGSAVHWTVRAVNSCGEAGEWVSTFTLLPPEGAPPPNDNPNLASADYAPLCNVYKDARCSNCHDEGQMPENHQEINAGQACTGCHTDVFPPDSQEPIWTLAPDDQQFTEVTCGEICQTVRSWALDHEGQAHDFIFHITQDPLIAWGFDPTPILSNDPLPGVLVMNHPQYASLSTLWRQDGYPCLPNDQGFPNLGDEIAGASQDGVGGGDGDGVSPDIDVITGIGIDQKLWWVDYSRPRASRHRLIKQEGLPPECKRLIVSNSIERTRWLKEVGRTPRDLRVLEKFCREAVSASAKR